MTLTLHTITRAACLVAAMSTLAACPPEKSTETDSATGEPTSEPSTSDAPTTGGPTSGLTETSIGTLTEGMSGTTTTETMGGATEGTTDDGTTTVTSDGTTTTGGMIPEELNEACLAACETFFMCIPQPPFPDVETCQAGCADSLGEGPTCLADTVALNHCLAALNCEEFEDAFMNEEFGTCEDEFLAADAGCAQCAGFGSQGPDGCSVGQQCGDQPAQEFACQGDTCTCLVDDEPTGTCPAPAGFCEADEAAQAEAAFACCGFEF